MAEQNRRLASCIGTEQSTELASSFSAEHQDSREPSQEAHIESRISMDSIPEIDRPVRQEGDSPRSVYTGDRLEGVNYSERSQSSETPSRRASRRQSSKRDSHRRHSDMRGTRHRSKDYNQARSDRKGHSRHYDSHDERRHGHHSSRRHDDNENRGDQSRGNMGDYSHDERGRDDFGNQYDNRNSRGFGENNQFFNNQRNYPSHQNFNDNNIIILMVRTTVMVVRSFFRSPYIGSAAHSLLVKETGQKGWIPKPASKPAAAKPAGTSPAPLGATGSKPFQKMRD